MFGPGYRYQLAVFECLNLAPAANAANAIMLAKMLAKALAEALASQDLPEILDSQYIGYWAYLLLVLY